MDWLDTAIKIGSVVVSIGSGAFCLSWWLGSRLDKITSQVLKLELRLSQRLTRLESKIFNGGFRVGDESSDD